METPVQIGSLWFACRQRVTYGYFVLHPCWDGSFFYDTSKIDLMFAGVKVTFLRRV